MKHKSERTKCLEAFQRLRVLEESKDGYAKCVTCGRVLPVSQMDGGHYIPRWYKHSELDHRNVHAQCRRCNRFLLGDLITYREWMVKEYGEDVVVEMEAKRDEPVSLTASDYREMAKIIRVRIREIEKRIAKEGKE